MTQVRLQEMQNQDKFKTRDFFLSKSFAKNPQNFGLACPDSGLQVASSWHLVEDFELKLPFNKTYLKERKIVL